MPLAPPEAAAQVVGDLRTVVSGRHADENATHVAWRLDGGRVDRKETGPDWALRFDDLPPGAHVVTVWSEGADRTSAERDVSFAVPGFDLPGDRDAPAPPAAAVLLLLLALAALVLRSRRQP